MSNYITRFTLELAGRRIDDWADFKEDEIVLNKVIPLVNKSGSAPVTQRFGFEATYVVPTVNPFDFMANRGAVGSATVEYDDGERIDYGGVKVVSVAADPVGGENELKRKVKFFAATRNGLIGSE
jgi:hypothetical protein